MDELLGLHVARRGDVVSKLNSFDKAPGTFGAVLEEWYDRSVASGEAKPVLRIEQLARLQECLSID